MKKTLIAIGVLILVVGAAFYIHHTQSGSQATDRALVIGFENDVPTFDPLRLSNVFALRVGSQVFEGLTHLDDKNMIVGAVAESWRSSPDFKTWTFRLRAGVKFHPHATLDAAARNLTAEDVVYSFTRMLSKDAVPAGPLSSVLQGAKEYQEGKAPSVSGLQVISSNEVEFKLIRSDALFPGRISSPAYGIVKKTVVDKAGADFGQTMAVGTGPFQFVERRGNELVFKRFSEYWGAGAGVESLIFRTVKEDAVRLAELKAGRLNATYATEPMLNGLVEKAGGTLRVKERDIHSRRRPSAPRQQHLRQLAAKRRLRIRPCRRLHARPRQTRVEITQRQVSREFRRVHRATPKNAGPQIVGRKSTRARPRGSCAFFGVQKRHKNSLFVIPAFSAVKK